MSKPGAFIISLDFELHWGVFDHTGLTEQSRGYFDRTRALISPTLELFERYGIRATWATVGMLFARDKRELLQGLPTVRPTYTDGRLDPYRLLDAVGADESDDPYHYAPSLIERVAATPGQDIGSHTFAHYYCLEEGQQLSAFTADLQSAQAITRRGGYPAATALVFPRNQYRPDYFAALQQTGFTAYRGNPSNWFWRVRSGKETGLLQRAARLSDNYVTGWGSTDFADPTVGKGTPVNVPASRFFRPYVHRIDGYGGQRLKVRRILGEMRRAAAGGRNYHLWWHPHNLATHPEKNLAALTEIFTQYTQLNKRYGWQPHSMESYLRQLPSKGSP